MADLQIICTVRFAYPGLGMFRVEHDTVEDRQAFLWTPERMEARFRSLEQICLRTLAVQTDQNFKTVILTGDALPEPYRSRLLKLASAVPGAEVVFHPPMLQRAALLEVLKARIDLKGPPVLYVRQDDDDGVARRFIARCRELFADVEPLYRKNQRLGIDFNRGIRITMTPDGPLVHHLFEPHACAAQGIILEPTNPRTGMHFPHHRLGTLMPCVTMPGMPMWLRGIDGQNDSLVAKHAHHMQPATQEDKAMLRRRFGLDLKAIRASFAG